MPYFGFYILAALYKAGKDELALRYVRERWDVYIKAGATTTWEGGEESPRTGGSLCHGWSGAPAFYLPAYVLGVRPTSPGYDEFLIDPHPADLDWAEGTVPTPHGDVKVRWKKPPAGGMVLEAAIPQGARALVRLPVQPGWSYEATLDGAALASGLARAQSVEFSAGAGALRVMIRP